MNESAGISAIIEKAESKLKTAHIDFDNGQYDDAVSRAYYAVYHILTAALFQKNLVFSSHSQTIGAFNREFVKTGIFPKEFTAMIQALLEERQSGDYDVASHTDKETAERGISDAETIVRTIKVHINKN